MPRARPNEGGGTAYVPAHAPQPYVPMQSPPSVGPPAGWYRDPGGRHQYRYWNGSGWTPGVADGPYGGQDLSAPPLSWGSGSPGPPAAPWLAVQEADTRAQLPPRAAGIAFGGIAAAVVLSFLGALVAALVLPHSRFLSLVLGQSGLWTGLVGAAWLASRKFGTGNVSRDFGLPGATSPEQDFPDLAAFCKGGDPAAPRPAMPVVAGIVVVVVVAAAAVLLVLRRRSTVQERE